MKRPLSLGLALLLAVLLIGVPAPRVYGAEGDPYPKPGLVRTLPPRETAEANRKTIAADYVTGYTLAIRSNGTVAVAGAYGGYGQCNVGRWTDIVSVATSGWHTVGLKADDTVVTAGYDEAGQCAVGDWKDIVAIAVGPKAQYTVGLRENGTVLAVGHNAYGQCEVSGWTDMTAVASGTNHTVGLKADGTVTAVGDTKFGQCSTAGWTDIVAVAAGARHTLGLKADGTVLAVGDNEYGQCNTADWKDVVAVTAGTTNSFGIKADGTVVAVGSNGSRQCNVADWTDIVAVAAGATHTVGLKADGTLVAAGSNSYGQCNVSDWKNILVPGFALAPRDPQVAAALQKIEHLSSVHMDLSFSMDMTMQVHAQGFDMSSVMKIDMAQGVDVQQDPHLVKGEIRTDMTIGPEQETTTDLMYLDLTGETPVCYLSLDEGVTWFEDALLADAVWTEDFFEILRHAEDLQRTGAETQNGRTVTVYSGAVALPYAWQSISLLDTLEDFFAADEGAYLSESRKTPITIWIDDESGFPVYYAMDMTDTYRELISASAEEMLTDEDRLTNIQMDIAAIKIECAFSQFDSVPPIVIPEAALSSGSQKPPQQKVSA